MVEVIINFKKGKPNCESWPVSCIGHMFLPEFLPSSSPIPSQYFHPAVITIYVYKYINIYMFVYVIYMWSGQYICIFTLLPELC